MFTFRYKDGSEKKYTTDQMDDLVKTEIIRRILEEVNAKGSARVGYHTEQVLNKPQFSIAPNVISKIEAKIIQDRHYISRPYFKSQGDYEILRNPNYKNEILQE